MTATIELPSRASQTTPPDEAPDERPSAGACGLDPDSAEGDRCRDVIPELIVELL